MRKLVLFDIDGTILSAGGIGRTAIYQAIEEVCGQAEVLGNNLPREFRQVQMSGKMDTQIVHEILEGVLPDNMIEALLPRIFDRIGDILMEGCKKEAGVRLLDGVQELIETVAEHDECLPGLLTGNNKRGAAAKLGVFALTPFFQFGAFGDDARYRSDLPAIAVQRAFERTGKQFHGKDIVILGDTPNDVACGRHLGVCSIAVATGRYSQEELRQCQPDYLFNDLSKVPNVMSAILSA